MLLRHEHFPNVFGGQSMSAMLVVTVATLLVMLWVKTLASTPNATPPNSAVPLRHGTGSEAAAAGAGAVFSGSPAFTRLLLVQALFSVTARSTLAQPAAAPAGAHAAGVCESGWGLTLQAAVCGWSGLPERA